MNFLNKKYTSQRSSPYSNSRSLLSSSTIHESSVFTQNNCEAHPSQLVRHLCLQCVELLCAECIGEHLQLHIQANIIPRIQSIKQVRSEMQDKLNNITSFIATNSQKQIEVDAIRRRALDKIEDMRKRLIKSVEEWISTMREHLLATLRIEQMIKLKEQMEKLSVEVDVLHSTLENGGTVAAVKKVYQLDEQMLEAGYETLRKKYEELQKKSDFQFVIQWKEIVKSFQTHIVIRNKQQISNQPGLLGELLKDQTSKKALSCSEDMKSSDVQH